jgi:hypothetical protein
MASNEWGYGLVPAFTFFNLFDKHKMALFDLNVRYYLERSSVNKQIIKTLSEIQGQKRFHLLNNGVTISCDNWRIPNPKSNSSEQNSDKWVTLFGPQIINGCQTVISIYRAYTQMDDEYKQRHLRENCLVPVRVIKTTKRQVLDEVVTASNNQNKMSQRNLRSNSRVQRVLQRKFDQLEHRWFYERKDGEYQSVKEYPTRGIKPAYYQSSKTIRRVSNELIANAWLSFIGFSSQAFENINAFELVDDGGRYEWLFEKRPNAQHWSSITYGPQVEFIDENFEPYSPSPEQLLLGYLIYEFTKANLPSPQANKRECINRLKQSRKINDTSTAEEINKAMMEDDEYVLYQILSNMKEVIVELFAWIFIKTYGPIDIKTASEILSLQGLSDLSQNPDFRSFSRSLNESNPEDKLNNVLFVCMGFIKEAVMRWKSVHERKYLVSERRTRFLHSSKTIEQFKEYLNQTNDSTKLFAQEWKRPAVTFLESLPKL